MCVVSEYDHLNAISQVYGAKVSIDVTEDGKEPFDHKDTDIEVTYARHKLADTLVDVNEETFALKTLPYFIIYLTPSDKTIIILKYTQTFIWNILLYFSTSDRI